MKIKFFLKICFLFFLVACGGVNADSFLKGVHRFKLDNGITVLIVSRGEAPVFSAFTRIKVGNIEESPHATGLAHFFEHMAFKGTPTIGTKNYQLEKGLLEEIHELGTKIVLLKKRGMQDKDLKSYQEQFKTLEEEYKKFIIPNEFVRVLQRHGGADLNANTSNDFTNYYVSLPSNRLEMWAYMESERLLNPVYREFYKEREVVAEERRMRYENSPDGQIYEAFVSEAFQTSPYKNNVIGKPEHIANYTYEQARAFHDRYYIPSRMVISLVGDLDVKKTLEVVKHYFEKLPTRPDSITQILPESLEGFPKSKTIRGQGGARMYVGFYRPAYPHVDDKVFDVLDTLLCQGRTSRLYASLVLEQKLASQVGCDASLPGTRLDGLFTIYAQPLPPHTNQDLFQGILEELHKLKTELVTSAELEKVKNNVDAHRVWAMKSNMGLASTLSFYESLTGNWNNLNTLIDEIKKIQAEDIQAVAKHYFISERQVTAFFEPQMETK
ncbi:MAG: hypothetical protein A3G32_00600 [Deltaproteobacteria bacterium RIFCSPLOWO2_12_FULL_40_28]|nr:MAG: hypothetical protein A3C45_10335 [Deltaproteobacteria bacterium RIFCSPHIGHO2_02_FULL_40_28]OGQ20189.1 MAG: hypothetical protein A3E27_01120 [Deltaproteobacteria bacterium RIFCSPHIGHO2_12_FULL_40_32]OGQ40180.1 MAG: hypothetical protein A3I69_09070 [Deltaproteobacteria bacterium RIFCSPLOWO2_02_FULL_40_36]OGQ54744.1 MAG: hypothetical protein A3G32_00600 [Deltaproteobacteria bacterium RIFCSPLOWO2_12_FULL_40_28]